MVCPVFEDCMAASQIWRAFRPSLPVIFGVVSFMIMFVKCSSSRYKGSL